MDLIMSRGKLIKDATVTIRVSDDIRKRFKVACVMTNTKATDVVEKAMIEFIEQYEAKEGK